MKFFDYKFLILLGLSLVVYFIYREVELIRSKVDKIEKELQNKSDYTITDEINSNNILTDNELVKNTVNKPILSLPTQTNTNTNIQLPIHTLQPTPLPRQLHILENIKKEDIVISHINLNVINDTNNVSKSSPKIINVDMSPSKINEQINFNSGVKINTNISANINMLLSDTECSNSSSSKHLAIYSNDNEQYDETQNSLLESIESHKIELNFNYTDKIPNLQSNVNEIINLVTTPNNSDKPNDSDKPTDSDKPNKDAELESNKTESGKTETNITELDENKFDQTELDENKFDQTELDENKLDKTKLDKKKLDKTKLDKKKLPEIKKIAESKNISLSKKINGHLKLKNKQELINEILVKKE